MSNAIGKVEIERMKETHFDGSRTGRNFSLDRQVEPLVMDSEISGLENRHAFLKLGNNVARFHFEYMDVPLTTPGFVPRKVEEDELPFDPKTLAPKTLAPKNCAVQAPEIDLEAEVPTATVFVPPQVEETAESESDEPTEEEIAEAGSDPDSPLDSGEVDSEQELQPAFNFEE